MGDHLSFGQTQAWRLYSKQCHLRQAIAVTNLSTPQTTTLCPVHHLRRKMRLNYITVDWVILPSLSRDPPGNLSNCTETAASSQSISKARHLIANWISTSNQTRP